VGDNLRALQPCSRIGSLAYVIHQNACRSGSIHDTLYLISILPYRDIKLLHCTIAVQSPPALPIVYDLSTNSHLPRIVLHRTLPKNRNTMCFFTKEKHGHIARTWDDPPPRTSYYSNYTSPTANRVATMPLFRGPKKIDVRDGHQHRYIEDRSPRHEHRGHQYNHHHRHGDRLIEDRRR